MNTSRRYFRPIWILAGGLGIVALLGSAATASAVTSGGTWGRAKQVAAALNQGDARLNSVSCASAGNCSAGGSYTDGPHHVQAFVVNRTHRGWRAAEEVPGTAALNAGGFAEVESVSCASARTCSAGGAYTDSSGHSQAFVVNRTHGSWRTAEEVPGTAALNAGGFASTQSVSCASAGTCSAGGYYTDGAGNRQAFVVSETGGVWGTAEEVPGTAALNQGGGAEITSLSCAAAGTCSAGGAYTDSSGHSQAFVVDETGGVWGTAEEVPGTAALNQGGFAQLKSVSCGSAGTCSAGGSYSDSFGHDQAFVVNRTHGIWSTAEPVHGPAIFSRHRSAVIFSVSCASAGSCSAGGSYSDSSLHVQAFVVDKTGGVWRTAREVPGTAALNQGGAAQVDSVSCGSAGTCSAGGSYTDSSGHGQAFVVNRTHGTWRTAEEVPGIAVLNTGIFAGIFSLSCAPVASCSAGGAYSVPSGHTRAFVVNKG